MDPEVPWADTPFKLIPTPGSGQNLSNLDNITFVAREMACAHNGMLRALNSIYQQCVFVKKPLDIQDLFLYTGFWCDWIHQHHEGEEAILFPKIEEITGIKGLMEVNFNQHHAFLDGLTGLQKYVKETSVEGYDGLMVTGIIDEFGAKLTQHLTDEIQTLLSLNPNHGVALRKACMEFDAEMRKGDKVRACFAVKVQISEVPCIEGHLHRIKDDCVL